MDHKTRIALAVAAAMVGAFMLGGIAFGAAAPVLARLRVASVERARAEAMQDPDRTRDGYGPRGRWDEPAEDWNADMYRGGSGRGDARRAPGMMRQRRPAPPAARSGEPTRTCPNCGEALPVPWGTPRAR